MASDGASAVKKATKPRGFVGVPCHDFGKARDVEAMYVVGPREFILPDVGESHGGIVAFPEGATGWLVRDGKGFHGILASSRNDQHKGATSPNRVVTLTELHNAAIDAMVAAEQAVVTAKLAAEDTEARKAELAAALTESVKAADAAEASEAKASAEVEASVAVVAKADAAMAPLHSKHLAGPLDDAETPTFKALAESKAAAESKHEAIVAAHAKARANLDAALAEVEAVKDAAEQNAEAIEAAALAKNQTAESVKRAKATLADMKARVDNFKAGE